LPLLELEWQSLKTELRQNTLPKVQIAVKSLPKDFSVFSERSKPYLPVKSVLAAVFIWQCGKVIWQRMLLSVSYQHRGGKNESAIPYTKTIRENDESGENASKHR